MCIRDRPVDAQRDESVNWDYAVSLKEKKLAGDVYNVKNSQFIKPLLEFSGACAGCGETPYAKLLTQLYGDRMYISCLLYTSNIRFNC